MARHKNGDWNLPGPKIENWQQVEFAVLMDIRDELQTLNRLLGCHNFMSVPHILRGIRRNTTKPKRKKGKT